MDINFDCPRCGQNISVDAEGAGTNVECPTCKWQITVPSKPIKTPEKSYFKPPPAIHRPPIAPPSPRRVTLEPIVTRRTEWSLLLKVVGGICIVGGGIGFLGILGSGSNQSVGPAFICLVIGVAVGLYSFFFAFLIDVFTDIRWFLKKLVDVQISSAEQSKTTRP